MSNVGSWPWGQAFSNLSTSTPNMRFAFRPTKHKTQNVLKKCHFGHLTQISNCTLYRQKSKVLVLGIKANP
jgi:hypothetical protein